MARQVLLWYIIVEKSRSEKEDCVCIHDDASIAQLMIAVATQNPYAMARNGADPPDLELYRNKSDLKEQKPVSKCHIIRDIIMGRQETEMFYIVIPRTADTLLATTVKDKVTGFDFLRDLIFLTEKRCCVTALNQRKLVTFAHGLHSSLKVGETVNIFSLSGNGFSVTVTNVAKDKDFVILQSSQDICKYQCSVELPYQGGEYIQVGLSATAQVDCPFSLAKGIFTSVYPNAYGQILGSGGSNPGESGGGCFSIRQPFGVPIVLGMNVGCEMVPISGSTTLYELGTRYPARALIVPAILFQ